MPTHAYLLCEIQGGRFAFEVDGVSEVVRMPWVTAIAETPPDVHGVVNYHGRCLAVVDPAPRLTGKGSPVSGLVGGGLESYLVVVSLRDDRVALVVDRVENVVQASCEPSPKDAAAPSFVLGHLDDGNGLVTVVDVTSLLRPDVHDFIARSRDSSVPPT